MTKLSDTQLVILSNAAQRDDLSVLPLPDSITLKGGALNKVMDSLRNRGLIRVLGGDGGPERVVITSEGMAAIGVEREDEDRTPDGATGATTGATAADVAAAVETPVPAAEADGAAKPARRKAKAKAKAAKAAPAERPTPRTGTKQALMIEMLKRPEGATVEQIAEATGWQHHTIRGAISGALKKKLGLQATSTKDGQGRRVYRLA
jgi:DNA-binding MarR family transcriptional regulator